ncbi:hypothetical protein QBC34DRAFT_393629 [Podospora aff. communis PSN243]|uniref:Ubiquitin-like domain-containing protein n=1 Tax=Podospora aff. communis PSN243 TaxID=3040156 RepID=A0AAV9GZU4_9PEZI|nr:hypothetical protein QBC34DRAFT_393629 [Podospora aff. communis PSN243]
MSFGYAIGDFIAGANLAHRLIRIMAETRGSSEEYREAMTELCGIQQAFIYVNQIIRSGTLPKATVNSASYIVLSSMEIIAKFLEQTKEYRRQLEASGNNLSGVSGSWCKVGWALYKKEELRSLRDSLHCRLVSVNTLFAAARHTYALPTSVSKFQDCEDEECQPSKEYSQSLDPLPGGEKRTSQTGSRAHELSRSDLKRLETEVQERLNAAKEKWEAEQAAATEEWKKAIDLQALNDARVELEIQRQADQRAIAAEEERKKAEEEFREGILQEATARAEEALKRKEDALKKQVKAPIKFKDAIGRKYTFPFHLIQTWTGMEELIKQAFLHVEVVGPQVQEGHYDLIGPDGEILIPTVWDKVIQPDWSITMHMWPLERMPQRPRFPRMGNPMMHPGINSGRLVHPNGHEMPPMGPRGAPPPPPPPTGHRGIPPPPPGGYGHGLYEHHTSGRPPSPRKKSPGSELDHVTVDSDTGSINTVSTSATRDEEEKKGRFGLGRLIPTKIAKIKLWKRSSSSDVSKKTGSESPFSSLNSSTVSFKTRKR